MAIDVDVETLHAVSHSILAALQIARLEGDVVPAIPIDRLLSVRGRVLHLRYATANQIDPSRDPKRAASLPPPPNYPSFSCWTLSKSLGFHRVAAISMGHQVLSVDWLPDSSSLGECFCFPAYRG